MFTQSFKAKLNSDTRVLGTKVPAGTYDVWMDNSDNAIFISNVDGGNLIRIPSRNGGEDTINALVNLQGKRNW